MRRGGHLHARAVSVCVGLAANDVLHMPRQSCAANERSGRGKRTGIYVPRRSLERAQEIIIQSSWDIFRNSILTMTTVDMGHVNFWVPPDFRLDTQRTASQKHHRGSAAATASQNQAMPLYNETGSRHQNSSKSKFKPKSPVVTDRPGFTTRHGDDGIEARGTCGTPCPGRARLICCRECSARS
jgi:hypothetical protein